MSIRISFVGATVLSIALTFSSEFAAAQDISADLGGMTAGVAELELEIADVLASNRSYDGGALAVIAALNLETLRLTKSMLEARIAAEEAGIPIEIVLPAVQPDTQLADTILADIQTQQASLDAAKAEAAVSGGLIAALALTRYETEKLSLAQLRQAWFRAKYGIAFPFAAPLSEPTADQASDIASPDRSSLDTAVLPDWADPNHREIDYELEVFKQLAASDYEISGWWGLERSRANLDDSPQVFAMNVSDYGTGYGEHPTLQVMCHENEARVVFNADSFIIGDYRSNTLAVTVRIGRAKAVAQRWSKLTNNKGAGLFGTVAQTFIRKLLDEDKVFLRLEGDRGQLYDLSIDLAGSIKVFEEVAAACQFSLLELGSEDYKAIQTVLNAAGFDAGIPDGQWGSGSRNAMVQFQASVGLPETGAPDRPTLIEMGILKE